MPRVAPETRKCPAEFQARITRMFGRNEFGDPHFKIVWGQSEFIRIGTTWRDKAGNERRGYKDRYQVGGGPAAWVIMRWHAPFEYGSPAAYYYNSLFEGMSICEYPWKGRYEPVHVLQSKEYINGQLVIEHFPLSHLLIDAIIPMIQIYAALSVQEKEVARQAVKAAEEKEQTEFIADLLQEHAPRFWGPTVSYTRNGFKSSVLQKKMDQIQAVWDRWCKGGRAPAFNRGMQQGRAPRPI